MRRYDSFSSGEFVRLCQRRLYVEPPQRQIDMNTIPDDGNEYIHKTRLESSRLDFSRSDMETGSDSEDQIPSEHPRMNKIQLRRAAAEFAQFANELQIRRESLKIKFPQAEKIPVHDEMNSCLFCLGSAKCLAIYECGPRSEVRGHLPLLSYAIHLNQHDIQKLLRHTFMWYKSIGMDEEMGRWVFALLACTEKPLSDELERFLVEYFDDFKTHLQVCDEEEYQIVRILMSLMENYFVIKNKLHDGEYLNQLWRLNP